MSEPGAPPPSRPFPLVKHHSWSPDADRDHAWLRRKTHSSMRPTKKSLTHDDLDELKACFDLGFRFDSMGLQLDPRLYHTFPALSLYCALNSSTASIITHGGSSEQVKAWLRQWAQVVASSLR